MEYSCKQCFDAGVVLVSNGPDDCDVEPCECGIEPIENALDEYLNRNPS